MDTIYPQKNELHGYNLPQKNELHRYNLPHKKNSSNKNNLPQKNELHGYSLLKMNCMNVMCSKVSYYCFL